MDIVYIFCHSKQQDIEILYSLRSVASYLPWVRKVWIFGDRPEWLSDDRQVVEYVPHEYLARPWRLQLPVKNGFLLSFLASLIPELSYEFLWFADDYILLGMMQREEIARVRAFEDLTKVTTRGKGLWKESLWRTHDTLRRRGYQGLNFESHAPQVMNKKLLWEAYCEFQDLVTEDRFYGLLMHTSIYNFAMKHWGLEFSDPQSPKSGGPNALWPLVWLKEEGCHAGFHGTPPTLAEIRAKAQGKTLMNFDDGAFGPAIQTFLAERFPERSKFEKAE